MKRERASASDRSYCRSRFPQHFYFWKDKDLVIGGWPSSRSWTISHPSATPPNCPSHGQFVWRCGKVFSSSSNPSCGIGCENTLWRTLPTVPISWTVGERASFMIDQLRELFCADRSLTCPIIIPPFKHKVECRTCYRFCKKRLTAHNSMSHRNCGRAVILTTYLSHPEIRREKDKDM